MAALDEYFKDLENKGVNVCMSGGADGADLIFEKCALIAKHDLYHWSFERHNFKGNHYYRQTLNENELKEADKFLKSVNHSLLKRTFPTKSEYVNNLLRRNYYQVKYAKNVYAVCELKNGVPQGGTAWAVALAAYLPHKPNIYVLDISGSTYLWRTYIGDGSNWLWRMNFAIPDIPKGVYAGIGTRNVDPIIDQKIQILYGL